jgi:hypothetical protein
LPPNAPPTCVLVRPAGGDQHGVALHRGDREPLVLDPHPDHVGGPGQCVAVGAALATRDVPGHVVELQGSVGLDRGLHVDHHAERVVVDVDELGRVHRLRLGLGDHDRDGLTDEPDLADGQGRARTQLVGGKEREARLEVQVVGGEHRDDTGGFLRLGHVDVCDGGVREGGADERGEEHAVGPHVVDVGAATAHEVRVLDESYGISEQRSDHGSERMPPLVVSVAVPERDTASRRPRSVAAEPDLRAWTKFYRRFGELRPGSSRDATGSLPDRRSMRARADLTIGS